MTTPSPAAQEAAQKCRASIVACLDFQMHNNETKDDNCDTIIQAFTDTAVAESEEATHTMWLDALGRNDLLTTYTTGETAEETVGAACAKIKDRLDVAVAEATRELTAERDEARELLAYIHRDGGHYHADHGFKKAVADGIRLVMKEGAERDALREELAKIDDFLYGPTKLNYEPDRVMTLNKIRELGTKHREILLFQINALREAVRVKDEALEMFRKPMAFALKLHEIGWNAPNDAQWERLVKLLAPVTVALSQPVATEQPQTRKDKLRMDYINSLPQPFMARFIGGDEWPIHDIDVETGLLRIDVCGKLQAMHIADVRFFRDAEGAEHDAESFYSDYVPPIATKGQEEKEQYVSNDEARELQDILDTDGAFAQADAEIERLDSVELLCPQPIHPDTVLKAAKSLVKRLDEIHNHPEYLAVWTMFMLHGGDYTDGPKYGEELATLRSAIDAAMKQKTP